MIRELTVDLTVWCGSGVAHDYWHETSDRNNLVWREIADRCCSLACGAPLPWGFCAAEHADMSKFAFYVDIERSRRLRDLDRGRIRS